MPTHVPMIGLALCRPMLLATAGALLAIASAIPITSAAQTEPPDPPSPPNMVIVNAKVWTGDKAVPEAEAIAITGNTIAAVGATAEIRQLADEHTRVFDAAGRRVIPGITDSHTHLIAMGMQLSRLDLRSAQSKKEFIDQVAAAASKLDIGKWLLGGRFSVESWQKPEAPTREWIDPVTPGTPVFLSRMDGHQALANSVALKFARIDRDGPPDPPGGEIERHPHTGEPTGILKDAAMDLVAAHIPPPGRREMYDALIAAMRVMNAWGITSVHDMTDLDQLEILAAARERNMLSLRISSFVQSKDFKADWPAIKPYYDASDQHWRIVGLKAYMDGSLGSRTAYMHEPYTDATADTKYPRGLRSEHAADLDAFAAELRWADAQDLQLAVHAIGDQAVDEVLDIYATLPATKSHRHRVEHAQHLLPADIARFGQLGVIASMQPLHKADDGRYAESAIGPQRAKTSYAFKSLLDANATVCFGSDCPVVTANPFSGIAAAVSSRTLDGRVWIPEQSISRLQALRGYTTVPPYAVHCEDRLGVIAAGRSADLAVLDHDVLQAPLEQLSDVESFMTIENGRVVWYRPDAESSPAG